MNHRQVREFLDAYVDTELDLVTTLDFERHVSECDECRAIVEQYQQLHASVKAQFSSFGAPVDLQNKIRAQLRSAEYHQHTGTPRGEWLPHWRTWSLAASVGIVIALGALLLQTAKRPSASQVLAEQAVADHIRSLMANHLTDVPSTDQHTVKPWFGGKLDFVPIVKDMSAEGFVLAGGRMDYLDDRPVAALVYTRRRHIINLFVWPSMASDSSLRTTTIKGYNVVHWTQSHMTYWAVSDLNAGELKEFARDLEK
jgi:anti-sigma factor RsiW